MSGVKGSTFSTGLINNKPTNTEVKPSEGAFKNRSTKAVNGQKTSDLADKKGGGGRKSIDQYEASVITGSTQLGSINEAYDAKSERVESDLKFTLDLCKRGSAILPPIAKPQVNTAYWLDSFEQKLEKMPGDQGYPVTMGDYDQLVEETDITELTFASRMVHRDEIKEKIRSVNTRLIAAGDDQKTTLIPTKLKWQPDLIKRLFAENKAAGNTKVTIEEYLTALQSEPAILDGSELSDKILHKDQLVKILDRLSTLNENSSNKVTESELAVGLKSTRAAQAFQQGNSDRKLESALIAGATRGALAAGLGVAGASIAQPELNPTTAPDLFDHILDKDTPVDELVIFALHNAGAVPGQGSLPFVATNQTMSIEDVLDSTPIRGFDLDLHEHNGELVLNHGGYFDPTVSSDNIPKVEDVLDSMNDWLHAPGNLDEVLFLNFENANLMSRDILDAAFGDGAVMGGPELVGLINQLGRVPTINEIRAAGYTVVVFDQGSYGGAGHGTIGIGGLEWDSLWEDRTVLGPLETTTDDVIAPPITTEQVDGILGSGEGGWVSLDHVTPDDPRFFKPEDRNELLLRPDLSLMGLFYESDQAFQTALFGFGTGAASATAAFALGGAGFQGYLNEKKIRNQDQLMPAQLKSMELSEILKKRKKNTKDKYKPLDREITVEEVMSLYKKKNLRTMSKDTAMAGAGATVSLTGSALALGMLFPPLFPAFGGAAIGVAGAGTAATIMGALGNNKRLSKAIKKAFELPAVEKALKERVAAMNKEMKECASKGGTADELLSSMVEQREQGARLMKASSVMLGTSLVARASGMAKYGMPAIGTAAMGVGAGITGILTALSARMNYRERRQKLNNLAQTTSEVLRPDYGRKQKRKLGLFGNTDFQRYLKSNRAEVAKLLNLDEKFSNKDLSVAFALPGNEMHLEYFLRGFAARQWRKGLVKFAGKQKPAVDFAEVQKDKVALKELLTKYAIKQVGKFAHNDTWKEGRGDTAQLALVMAFSGIFFLPMLGVAGATLLAGLPITKAVAKHEEKLFTRKLTELIENPPKDSPEKIAAHNSLHKLINSWTELLVKPD
ncbi:hypothetical protein [uncultured Endozoicomonas sp.]|uniref:hypothetical protein n=1 Tax=uncultured Endozoicomonas sp. TaxID=432652 RepID=UPI0026258620|nr:hypothetical protein [uncultured Endozoicomonas sp.]